MALPARAAADVEHGWRAQLDLGFEARVGRTALVRRSHRGPLMVQSPFYPEGPVCHVYVLHPPGGVVAGDSLEVRTELAPDAHALITTPAATKLYRSEGRRARIGNELRLADRATLEWLPQESIAFRGARVDASTRVHLRASSRFIGWDAVVLGRPACGESFTAGALRQDLEIWCDGEPLLIERNALDASSPILGAAWGLSGRCVAATLLLYPSEEHLLAAARDVLDGFTTGRGAATDVDGVLVCRVIACDMRPVRDLLARLWHALRPRLLARPAVAPRIWAT